MHSSERDVLILKHVEKFLAWLMHLQNPGLFKNFLASDHLVSN